MLTAITPSCQQLILIGDHQQLRPGLKVLFYGAQIIQDFILIDKLRLFNLNNFGFWFSKINFESF